MGILDRIRREVFAGGEEQYGDEQGYGEEYTEEYDEEYSEDEGYEQESDEDEFEEEEYVGAAKSGTSYSTGVRSSSRSSYSSAPKAEKKSDNRVLNIHATAQLQVVISRPETLEDAKDIVSHLKDRHAVVVNLDGVPRDLCRRIFDFLTGVSYAINGHITRVANTTFLITPYNVGLIDEDVIDELENKGVLFF